MEEISFAEVILVNNSKGNRSFQVIIEKDSSGYIASCPSLEGCYSQGDTFEEVLSNIQEAIALCMEDSENYNAENTKSVIVTQVVV